jgi:pimeloyl-ACP methyl ester carboxylesterase
MKKVAYIIPGYGESHTRQPGYDKVAAFFEEQDIKPVHMEIGWLKRKPGKFKYFVADFLKKYKKNKGTETYVLGFSFGAIIAFLTAQKLKPKAIILCSLSPYFKEDLPKLNPEWVKWWRETFSDGDYVFTKLAKNVKVRTYLIVGGKDYVSCIRRAKDAKRKIKGSTLTIAKGAKHKISQKAYLDAVKKVIKKL